MRRCVAAGVAFAMFGAGCTPEKSGAAEREDAAKAEPAPEATTPAPAQPEKQRAAPKLELPLAQFETSLAEDLDLAPTQGPYIVVREPAVWTEAIRISLEASGPILDEFGEFIKIFPTEAGGEWAEAQAKHHAVSAKLERILALEEIDLTKPAVFIRNDDADTYVLALVADPDKPLAERISPAMNEIIGPCAPAENAGERVVCGAETSYRAAGKGKALAKKLGATYGSVPLERVNILARSEDAGEPDVLVTTDPGRWTFDVAVPEGEMESLQTGPARTLALAKPTSSFGWVRFDATGAFDAFEEKGEVPPEILKGFQAIQGEAYFADFGADGGFLLHTDDPEATKKTLLAAWEYRDQLPPSLPDDPEAELHAERETKAFKGEQLDVFSLRIEGGQQTSSLDALGLESKLAMTVAGDYLVVGMFGVEGTLAALEASALDGLSSEAAELLPPRFVADLNEGRLLAAYHIELDSLLSQSTVGAFDRQLGFMTPEMREKVFDQIRNLMSLAGPLSHATVWVSREGKRPVVHVDLSAFGNSQTPEGAGALEAVRSVLAGADPTVVYPAFAAGNRESPQGLRYAARAGEQTDAYAVIPMVAIVGVLAAIAIPAWSKYSARAEEAKAAGEGVPAVEPAAE